MILGRTFDAAQVLGGPLTESTEDEVTDLALHEALLRRLRDDGVGLAYAAVPDDRVGLAQQLGFERLFEAFGRNLYVGFDKVSSRLSKAALDPVRRFAERARRIRPKLVEAPVDDAAAAQMARLVATDEAGEESFGLLKDEAYYRWRYVADPRASRRLVTYRSKAGQGVSAFAVVRRFEPEGGRSILHLDEVWTRRASRRDLVKLVGEIAMLALSEQIDALRGFAAAGSQAEQALIGLGCIRKKVDRHVMVKVLAGPALTWPDAFPTRDLLLSAGDFALYDS